LDKVQLRDCLKTRFNHGHLHLNVKRSASSAGVNTDEKDFSDIFSWFFVQKIGVYPRLHLHLNVKRSASSAGVCGELTG